MFEVLNNLDHSLMLWLNYDGGALQDRFWFALSNKYSWIPMYVAILTVIAVHAKRTHQWSRLVIFILATALTVLLADQIASGIIKPWVQRPRPSHQEGIMEQLHYVNDYRGGAFGFASSHAANTIGIARLKSMFFRRSHLTWAMSSFALLNCYSRIYLGVHYLGDILAGVLIGLVAGWIGYRCFKLLEKKLKLAPANAPNPLPITITFWASIVVMLGIAHF